MHFIMRSVSLLLVHVSDCAEASSGIIVKRKHTSKKNSYICGQTNYYQLLLDSNKEARDFRCWSFH